MKTFEELVTAAKNPGSWLYWTVNPDDSIKVQMQQTDTGEDLLDIVVRCSPHNLDNLLRQYDRTLLANKIRKADDKASLLLVTIIYKCPKQLYWMLPYIPVSVLYEQFIKAENQRDFLNGIFHAKDLNPFLKFILIISFSAFIAEPRKFDHFTWLQYLLLPENQAEFKNVFDLKPLSYIIKNFPNLFPFLWNQLSEEEKKHALAQEEGENWPLSHLLARYSPKSLYSIFSYFSPAQLFITVRGEDENSYNLYSLSQKFIKNPFLPFLGWLGQFSKNDNKRTSEYLFDYFMDCYRKLNKTNNIPSDLDLLFWIMNEGIGRFLQEAPKEELFLVMWNAFDETRKNIIANAKNISGYNLIHLLAQHGPRLITEALPYCQIPRLNEQASEKTTRDSEPFLDKYYRVKYTAGQKQYFDYNNKLVDPEKIYPSPIDLLRKFHSVSTFMYSQKYNNLRLYVISFFMEPSYTSRIEILKNLRYVFLQNYFFVLFQCQVKNSIALLREEALTDKAPIILNAFLKHQKLEQNPLVFKLFQAMQRYFTKTKDCHSLDDHVLQLLELLFNLNKNVSEKDIKEKIQIILHHYDNSNRSRWFYLIDTLRIEAEQYLFTMIKVFIEEPVLEINTSCQPTIIHPSTNLTENFDDSPATQPALLSLFKGPALPAVRPYDGFDL